MSHEGYLLLLDFESRLLPGLSVGPFATDLDQHVVLRFCQSRMVSQLQIEPTTAAP